MSVKRMRPTFRMVLPLPPEAVLDRVHEALETPGCLVVGTIAYHGFEIQVPPAHEHLWSPWLTVEVRPHPGGSLLWARFSPKPEVWSFILFLYALCAFVGMGCLMWGLSQLGLGGSTAALWGVPAAGLGAVGVYLTGFVGQGLGGAQMYVLRRFLDQTLPTPQPED